MHEQDERNINRLEMSKEAAESDMISSELMLKWLVTTLQNCDLAKLTFNFALVFVDNAALIFNIWLCCWK